MRIYFGRDILLQIPSFHMVALLTFILCALNAYLSSEIKS
nr:MAG TPA: hypothetical protein [Caudoviricetes sp.]